MIKPSKYRVPTSIIEQTLEILPEREFRVTINEPTGDFFYDNWVLKKEYIGTVWETLYNSLPVSKGEARVITLDPGTCYQSHADIDDRWHLNIRSESAYLIDLSNGVLHKIQQDGIWYDMDAGPIHSAANFGRPHRVQLVVRKLLLRNTLINPVNVRVSSSKLSIYDSRYEFDQAASMWLNRANKNGTISNFKYDKHVVTFDIERKCLDEFKSTLSSDFDILTND